MNTLEHHRLKTKVDNLFNQIDRLGHSSSPDLEAVSSLTKYACVRVAGLIERSLNLTLAEYANQKGHPNLANFVSSQLRSFMNPKAGKVEDLLRSFNTNWCDNLQSHVDYEQLKGSLNSLMTERHAIAHGQDSTITVSRLKQYYKDALILLKHLSLTIWS